MSGKNVPVSIRLPTTPDELELVQRWVVADLRKPGRYMRLKGIVPLLDRPEQARFEADLARDARQISDDELCTLLELDWRAQLTAVWLIGLDKRSRFRAKLEKILTRDEIAPDRACFLAFVRFGESADADILVAYLESGSPTVARRASTREFAFDALTVLDDQLGTGHSRVFSGPVPRPIAHECCRCTGPGVRASDQPAA
ncbi:DUF6000 family protein [Nocardia sp. NPDC005978]|uniref:DUF6000 family protein n=1 Tax=Nocardia sp. NPDC005978 TaxID=3156725 RepID=UPI0033B5CEDE